jgi:predicted  nucleic acid-binding Zn-ribbon protein
MPLPPEKRPDRHYNFRSTNVVFALSSIALLLVTIWMVVPDYAKPWKRLQSQFRDLEREAVREELEAEKQGLNANELAQLQAEVAQERDKLSAQREELSALENERVKLGKKIYGADAQSRGTKSLLDTARFELDSALQRGRGIEDAQAEVDGLVEKWTLEVKELQLLTEQKTQVEADLAARRAALDAAQTRLAALEKGVDGLNLRIAALDKRLD